VSRYQKGKTNLDFTAARDSEWQWHHLGHMQVCISLQADNHASTSPLSFLQAGCPSCRPTNSVKALKATYTWQTKFCINVHRRMTYSSRSVAGMHIRREADFQSTKLLHSHVFLIVDIISADINQSSGRRRPAENKICDQQRI